MNAFARIQALIPYVLHALRERIAIVRKAVSFALIGVVNTTIDAGVFFLAYAHLTLSASAVASMNSLAIFCRCGSADNITLVTANVIAWIVAVSGSYVMNSFITFAAESGRQLRWRAYGAFLASGVAGVIVNTTTLVVAAQFLPVWAAKGCAILAAFLVNFSLSHFVVFRPRASTAGEPR